MWCAMVRRQHCLPTAGPLIGSFIVTPSSAVHDLSVYIDFGLTIQSHVRQTVSLFYVSCVLYVAKYQLQCSSRSLLHSFFPDWITATVSCLESLLTSSSVSNLFRMLRFGYFSEFDGQNTLPQCSSACCASWNVSTSNWQLWRIDPSTAPLHPTHSHVSPALLTWRPDNGCGLLPRIVWNSERSARSSLYSRQAAFPVYGATVWNDLPLHVASAPSLAVFRQRPFCFPVPTKTLLYDSCVTITIHHYFLDTYCPSVINII